MLSLTLVAFAVPITLTSGSIKKAGAERLRGSNKTGPRLHIDFDTKATPTIRTCNVLGTQLRVGKQTTPTKENRTSAHCGTTSRSVQRHQISIGIASQHHRDGKKHFASEKIIHSHFAHHFPKPRQKTLHFSCGTTSRPEQRQGIVRRSSGLAILRLSKLPRCTYCW